MKIEPGFRFLSRDIPSLTINFFLLQIGVLFLSASSLSGESGEIVFTSDLDGEWAIYTMNADGTDYRKLTKGGTPSWSPDGNKIAFVFGLHRFFGDLRDVFVIDVNGENRINLTKGRHKSNLWPSWSPDGTKIALTSNHDGPGDIHVMDANGRNSINITLDEHLEDMPRWSPDGRRIAFSSSWLGAGNLFFSDIYIIDADGGNRMNLTRKPRRYNAAPSWSPDGQRIAYGAYSNDARFRRDIFVINADGTQPARLTEDFPVNAYPSWSSDGTKIAFVRKTLERDDSSDIYVMSADGTAIINLTQTPGVSESKPSWRPGQLSVSSQGKIATEWGAVKAAQ